jgi:hypothetical protein
MTRQNHRRPVSAFGLRPSFGFRISDLGFLPKALLSCIVLLLALHPAPLLACAACFGQSDSPMAQGMNWGIFSLLAVIGAVLGGVVAFFIYLARRSAAVAAQAAEPLLPFINAQHELE